MKDLSMFVLNVGLLDAYVVEENVTVSLGSRKDVKSDDSISFSLADAIKEKNTDEVRLIRKLLSLKSGKADSKLVLVDKREIEDMDVTVMDIQKGEKVNALANSKDFALFNLNKDCMVDISYDIGENDIMGYSIGYDDVVPTERPEQLVRVKA